MIPLVISGVVLIGFLINFKHFGLQFNNHFNYGAGVLYSNTGLTAYPPLLARIFLHISLFAIFLGGILLFVSYKRISKAILLTISVGMIIVFVLRPLISVTNYFMNFGWPNGGNGLFEFVAIPTLMGQLIGNVNESGQYNSLTIFQGYLGGIVLLLLLLVNLIFSFIRKGNRVSATHAFMQPVPAQSQAAYPAPMSMPVQQQGISVSMTQELERLQQMYQSGALTEAEFTAAKKRVLGN